MEDIRNKKYLVTVGCSQTWGQLCPYEETWAYKLAKKLNLELINLAVCGIGWNYVQTTTTQFINYNKDIIDDCFFVLQNSMLERRLNYGELPHVRTDIFEEWNIKYLSAMTIASVGFKDWEKFGVDMPEYWGEDEPYGRNGGCWTDESNIDRKFEWFPEHRHYPSTRHGWKIGENNDITPPYLDEQFEELMLYWAREVYSFHIFLKELNVDHIMVDGYTPFLTYKLNFRDYYNDPDEYEFHKRFWSTQEMEDSDDDINDIKLYDFKNIKSGWLFDKISIKNKIDDVILWSLYQYYIDDRINADGGHAGPIGMDRMFDVIYTNLIEKGWVNDTNFEPTFKIPPPKT